MGQVPLCMPASEGDDQKCCVASRCFTVEADFLDPKPDSETSRDLASGSQLVCLEPDHVREIEASLPAELHRYLLSKEFVDRCGKAFRAADKNNNGFLELQHDAGEVSSIVHELLPDLFLNRLDGVSCESCARCFDADWDGKLNRQEFAGFVRWCAAMQARGFLHGQAPFAKIGTGTGERLLVVSEYLDFDNTLVKAAKAGVDIAVYNPSGINQREFAQQLRAAQAKRAKNGMGPYKTVGLANHGPDSSGTWSPFMGAPRDLTVATDVEDIMPALLALADLLPQADGSDEKRGRMDLLACELGSAPGGLALVERLERETWHTVCASVDATGNAAHGGNWVLEIGNVNVAPDYFDEVKLEHFEHLMMGHGRGVHRPHKKTKSLGSKSGQFVSNKKRTEESSEDDDDDDDSNVEGWPSFTEE